MDDFSDDVLDDLDPNALEEIEHNAIQFTQAQARPTQTQQPAAADTSDDYGYLEDDDLDDTLVIDELSHAPARQAAIEKPLAPQHPPRAVPNLSAQQRWNPPQPSSYARYQTPSQVALPQRPYQQPAQPPPRLNYEPGTQAARPALGVPPSQFPRPPAPAPINSRYTAQSSQSGPPNNQDDVLRALQERLRALETDLYTAKGEASLMRSKYETAQKSHDAEVSRLKKLNTEQLSKQERAVELALAAEKSAATDLEFTRQDLKEVLNKAKKGKKDTGATTPRKGAGGRSKWDMADGFDDVEMLPSPSKGQGRRNKDAGPVAIPVAERTPTKGKRKRPAVDSPVLALETHSDDVVMLDDSPSKPVAPAGIIRQAQTLPFDFLKLALDHHGHAHRPMTFDAFAQFAFPSDPNRTFASIILHKLPVMGNALEPIQLPVDFCQQLLELWSQCLSDKYHEPLFDLVSLVLYVVQLDTMSIAPRVMSTLVPIAQTTISLVGLPAFHSADGDLANHPSPAVQQLFCEIPSTEALSLLYLTALSCLTPPEAAAADPAMPPPEEPLQVQFWKRIQITFVLMLLSPKQPPDEFLGALALLRASVLPASIGPISDDADKDAALIASVIVDRVSHHLVELPRWATAQRGGGGGGCYRACEVRLELLRTLIVFGLSAFGKRQLALSEVAVPRLVAALCGAVDALYDMDIPAEVSGRGLLVVGGDGDQGMDVDVGGADAAPGLDGENAGAGSAAAANNKDYTIPPPPPEKHSSDRHRYRDPAPLLHALISSTVALLHALATDEQQQCAVAAKLAAFPGGSQRYLLTLARLNFAEEDLVYEAGIGGETVEMAHELLEMAVTPDEGEGIGEVFGL